MQQWMMDMSDLSSARNDSKHAWCEVPRVGSPKRPVAARLADFLEIYGPYDEATARQQASRCVQCPDPVCISGCPLDNRIPEWLALTADGHFSEAAALLHSTGSLPEITARFCAADRRCEARCILDGKAEPVSIRAIEQFLNEYAFAHGEADQLAAKPNGLRVAVVGAGPGGLTCADALSRRGFSVTVFDWRLVAGGLLVSGTPAFRMDQSVVERRTEMLRKRGVKFRLGAKLGEDFTFGGLRIEFDAIYFGFGARRPRELALPGRHLQGVNQALSLLIQEQAPPGVAPRIGVSGKRVVVLGAGDMAMDCLRTALRLGASAVVGVSRHDEQNLSCNPAEYQNAVEEGAKFIFLASPRALLGNAAGEVTSVQLQRTVSAHTGEEAHRPPHLLPGSGFEVSADLVFLALGFEAVPPPATDPFDMLARNENGAILVDERQMTSLPGVFAGGDLVHGPGTVLEVVREARRAAQGIEAHLIRRPSLRDAGSGSASD